MGYRNLCNLSDEVAREVVKEFYDNLTMLDGLRLKSEVVGKKINVSRKDLINCFDLKDEKDDQFLVSATKSDLFKKSMME